MFFQLSRQKKKKKFLNEKKNTKFKINPQKIIEKGRRIQKMVLFMIDIGP